MFPLVGKVDNEINEKFPTADPHTCTAHTVFVLTPNQQVENAALRDTSKKKS